MTCVFRTGSITIVLCLSVVSLAQDDMRSLAKRLRPSVVTIVAYDKQKKILARGAGFFTSKSGEIVTRRRVFPTNADHAEAITSDGKSHRVLRRPSEGNNDDLVSLSVEISPERVNPVVFTRKIPQANERVVIFKLVGSEQQPVEGTVLAIEESSSGKVVRISATLDGSSDGAPVFDTSGQLVGVTAVINAQAATFTANAGESLNGLVPVSSEKEAEMARTIKPVPLNSPMPQYTDLARFHGVQGSVSLRVLIDEEGKVIQAKLLKGLRDGLDEEAIKAAFRLKFKPATRDGKPLKYWMAVLVEFRLGR